MHQTKYSPDELTLKTICWSYKRHHLKYKNK